MFYIPRYREYLPYPEADAYKNGYEGKRKQGVAMTWPLAPGLRLLTGRRSFQIPIIRPP